MDECTFFLYKFFFIHCIVKLFCLVCLIYLIARCIRMYESHNVQSWCQWEFCSARFTYRKQPYEIRFLVSIFKLRHTCSLSHIMRAARVSFTYTYAFTWIERFVVSRYCSKCTYFSTQACVKLFLHRAARVSFTQTYEFWWIESGYIVKTWHIF